MPETRLERAIFVLGAVAIVGLAFVIVRSWHHTSAAPPAGVLTTPSATAASTTTTSTPPSAPVRLALTASRGAAWIEVRAGSRRGGILYAGVLAAGSTRYFRRARIWVRFGAASNLDARLNGKPVRLPPGTYDAVFDARGYRRLT